MVVAHTALAAFLSVIVQIAVTAIISTEVVLSDSAKVGGEATTVAYEVIDR